jgi:1-acyl-sn-glycerol-3-phosphate acyltransferase
LARDIREKNPPGEQARAMSETWHYDPARDLDEPLLERLKSFPREPDMLVYGSRFAAALALRAWLRVYHRLEIIGRENLPATGSLVLVANHSSHLDALCLLSALPLRRLHRAFPAAAQDYFFVSVPRLLLATVVVNALPFQRNASPRQSLTICRKLLEVDGNILVLFPEGTRTTGEQPAEFKPGVGLIVAGTEIPVVPCYLEGAGRAWPKGKNFPRPRRVRVKIGPPRKYPHLSPGKVGARAVAEDLRNAVLALAVEPH